MKSTRVSKNTKIRKTKKHKKIRKNTKIFSLFIDLYKQINHLKLYPDKFIIRNMNHPPVTKAILLRQLSEAAKRQSETPVEPAGTINPTGPIVPTAQRSQLTPAQQNALIRRQKAQELRAKQLRDAALQETVNREEASHAAGNIVMEHASKPGDIPQSMQVDGKPLTQPNQVTAREAMKPTNTFFSTPYERSMVDKTRLFNKLRHEIVPIALDLKFKALREIDSIERSAQKKENYDEHTGLYADDQLAWLAEMEKASGDITIIVAKLAESSDNGFISTARCDCLTETKCAIESKQSEVVREAETSSELVIGSEPSDEEVSEDSGNESPPKPVRRVKKTVVRKVPQKKRNPRKK